MITKRITPAKTMGKDAGVVCLLCGILSAVGAVLLISCSFGLAPSGAQESALDKGPPPPYVEPAAPPVAPEPTYDPLRAEKSIEIGAFYMKRGNYDAAIERFQDAAHFQPKLARPYALLGEAYEKKGELDNAVTNYKKYLEVYRTAPDQEKILKRIEKLQEQTGPRLAKKKSR